MTIFGIKEAEVAQLVRAVTDHPDTLDRAGIVERFARATWSGIAEPGDRVAHRVTALLGAERALELILADPDPRELVAELADASPDHVPGPNGSDTEWSKHALDEAARALDRWRPRAAIPQTRVALLQAARFGARLRVPGDELWPDSVDDLQGHAPLALWTRGTDAALRSLGSSVALVGARAATGYGEHVTMEASAGLVDRGYSIVSGAAYGIDGMAHRAALASGGHTIAFLAGGVDRFYPSGHDALLTRIVERGVVISELPCGAAPTKWRFLQRNRLIAAASLATIVLEAGARSGSLNTAHHAADLGRPIGAVPGPVTSAASTGCHQLIRDGLAHCVTHAGEMAELAPLPGAEAEASEGTDPRDHPDVVRLLDALSTRTPRTPATIATRSGLAISTVLSVLGQLELDGRVRERASGWVR